MSVTDQRFIVIMPVESLFLAAFFRLCSILDTLDGPEWLTNTYTAANLISLNSGAYLGNGMPVVDGSGTMLVIDAFKDGVAYSDDIFNVMKAGNAGNAGLTEDEFNGVRTDLTLITTGLESFESYIAGNGYTIDE